MLQLCKGNKYIADSVRVAILEDGRQLLLHSQQGSAAWVSGATALLGPATTAQECQQSQSSCPL